MSHSPPPPARLTPEQILSLDSARDRMRKIRRAASVGKLDAYSLIVFAFLSLLGGYSSATGIFISLGLAAVAAVELRAIPKLEKLDERAAATLAWNQVALAAVLITYALWCLLFPAPLPTDVLASKKDLQSLGFDIDDFYSQANRILYYGLIALAITCQGYCAIFHFRRKKLIADYKSQTPEWITQLQQSGVGI